MSYKVDLNLTKNFFLIYIYILGLGKGISPSISMRIFKSSIKILITISEKMFTGNSHMTILHFAFQEEYLRNYFGKIPFILSFCLFFITILSMYTKNSQSELQSKWIQHVKNVLS